VFFFIAIAVSSVSAEKITDFIDTEQIGKLDKIKSIKMFCDAKISGMEGIYNQVYEAPDKFYGEMDLGLLKVRQIYDGSQAWLIDQNDQVLELTGYEKSQLISSIYLLSSSYVLKNRMAGEERYLKDSTVSGVNYAVFFIKPENGDSLHLFINRDNGRLEIFREWMDDIIMTTFASDFRMVSGVEMAYQLDTRSNLPQLNLTAVVTDIQINTDIDQGLFKLPGSELIDFSFPAEADSIIVPMKYQSGHIFVNGSVNGKKEATFILDTGAGANMIKSKYAEEIGLESSGELPSRGVAGYGRASLTNIDSLYFGGITLYDQVGAVVDLSTLKINVPGKFAGVFGFGFLSRFPFRINYTNEQLVFYHPDKFTPPDSNLAVDLEFFMKIPMITASYGDFSGKFIIDLGNPVSLILHNGFVERYNLKDGFTDIKELAYGISGIGGESKTYAVCGEEFTIGPVTITKPPMMIAESESGLIDSDIIDGNIGNLMLEKFSILLDYSGKKIYILSPE
jgi:predicted aspartyl protease